MVIKIINDKSPDAPFIAEATEDSIYRKLQKEFKNNYLLYWELNDINKDNNLNPNDTSLNYYKDDIRSKYAHRKHYSEGISRKSFRRNEKFPRP